MIAPTLISEVTLARVLSDEHSLYRHYQTLFLKRCGPLVHGNVVELGGEVRCAHAAFFPNATSFVVTNIARDYERYEDMTALSYASGGQDAFLCASVLEHVADFARALAEIERALRPGGRLVLTMPFLFPFSDDRDYWRFSRDGYEHLFAAYEVNELAHFGGRISTVVDLLQRPKRRRDRRSLAYKTMAALIAGLLGRFDTLDGYPLGIGFLATKR